MISHEVVFPDGGERIRQKGLGRVIGNKPLLGEHVFFHRLPDVMVKELRSIGGGIPAVREINRRRSLHGHAHGDLELIYLAVERARTDLQRLNKTKQVIRDKAERIARYEAIIENAPMLIEQAKKRVHETNDDLRLSDRREHTSL